MKFLPFDSHSHVHMGPSLPMQALTTLTSSSSNNQHQPQHEIQPTLSGMALMSTHPRDFAPVEHLANYLPQQFTHAPPEIVPCFGVHPWFLHELNEEDWATTTADDIKSNETTSPRWLEEMERYLMENPKSIVGEIGLDGFHYNGSTGELSSSMELQVQAFELQMKLASRLQRPVSVHSVQCFGPLMKSLSHIKKQQHALPPKIYFHAFGGKEGTVDQLLALCGGKEVTGNVYFGFAPIVNFRSGKTANVARKVGLERILLETDHEDASRVNESIGAGISFLADCFGLERNAVVEQTTKNAFDFYGISYDNNNSDR